MTDIKETNCPICGENNRCGEKAVVNGITLEKCWCAYETFPEEIISQIPKEKKGKACVCINCLNQAQQDTHISSLKLRKILTELANTWQQRPDISWSEIYQTGEKLLEWKTEKKAGLWPTQPTMITATLDDAIGQGLKMIHLYSRIAGIDIIPLGLMQPPDVIIDACHKQQPDLLGMTVLQFDSEEDLSYMVTQIPKKIKVLVGGPIFKMLSQETLKEETYIVINNVGAYLAFLLNYQ